MKTLFNLFILIAIGFGVYGVFKALPEGVSIAGEVYSVPQSGVVFFEDTTYVNADGVRVSNQEIFDEVFRMIARANEYILIDMFLFNDFLGKATESYRGLSGELTNALVTKTQTHPNIDIVLITDPINEIYGGYDSPQLNRLRESGVQVIVTDLLPLRDSNPIYSAFYRPYLRWEKPSTKEGKFANPFDERLQNLTLGSYFSLLNFKANHRKLIMSDFGNTLSVLITSANPHDGSSAHTNTAVRMDDHIWKDVLASERAVATFSGVEMREPSQNLLNRIIDREGSLEVQLLTEGKIRDRLLEDIAALDNGDSIDIAMFYLSDRKIIEALKRAADRSVDVRVLLDPNKDAFGREKNGIPNRPVASELIKAREERIDVRFCNTRGEQCHTKMILLSTKENHIVVLGSANLTRRNIGDFNLETNVRIAGENIGAINEAKNYFEKVWNNTGGRTYSVPYEEYKDESIRNMFLYRIMEDLGTSSF